MITLESIREAQLVREVVHDFQGEQVFIDRDGRIFIRPDARYSWARFIQDQKESYRRRMEIMNRERSAAFIASETAHSEPTGKGGPR